MCSGGWPNTAVVTVLDAAERAVVAVRVHADFDSAGVAIVERLTARSGASRWRFDIGDCARAAAGDGGSGVPEESGVRSGRWGDSLTAAMRAAGVTVSEEAVVDDLLLRDLDARPSTSAGERLRGRDRQTR